MLSAGTKATLESKLADLEQKSRIQLVVATVPDLGGDEIEPYANALFREWKLGEKDKNNGVLFLIAPKLRKMRIEVGYGLEGTLTDAASKVIIANAAAPRFKKGDYDGGVTRAVEDIITTLTTDSSDWKAKEPASDASGDFVLPLAFFLFILFMMWFLSRRTRRTGGHWIAPMNSSGGWSSGGSSWSSGGSSSSSDSGFSGGGGSSGGGGASGDW